jgi:hypothetical protein
MAIFRLCPPIKAGPQPPWCINEERFEKDFAVNSLTGHLKSSWLKVFPGKNYPLNEYDPTTDDITYFEKPIKKDDYTIEFGIAQNDFSWPVCRTFNDCIVPTRGIKSTFDRANSIGADLILITDYAHNNMKKEIYDDKIGLSKKEINKKLTSAKENNLKTMIVTNLFIDDTETRHTEVDKEIEENTRRAGSSAIAKSVDYWQPNEANMNILFDNWAVSPNRF